MRIMITLLSALPTVNFIHAQEITSLSRIAILAFGAFLVSMLFVPFFTRFAYNHKLWKQPRETAITGEKAPIYQKLHAAKHKRLIPTMGGVPFILAIAVVTLLFNLSRSQTYLP